MPEYISAGGDNLRSWKDFLAEFLIKIPPDTKIKIGEDSRKGILNTSPPETKIQKKMKDPRKDSLIKFLPEAGVFKSGRISYRIQ